MTVYCTVIHVKDNKDYEVLRRFDMKNCLDCLDEDLVNTIKEKGYECTAFTGVPEEYADLFNNVLTVYRFEDMDETQAIKKSIVEFAKI